MDYAHSAMWSVIQIWSTNAPDFWEKRAQQHLRRKSRRIHSEQSKDVGDIKKEDADDIKSQFVSYGDEAQQSEDSIVFSENERVRQELIKEIVDTGSCPLDWSNHSVYD